METFDEWLALVHILAAMIWVGGAATLVVVSVRLTASGDQATMRNTALVGAFLGRAIYTPAAAVALAAGSWLVSRVDGFDWSSTWIVIGLAGIAWGAATGMGFFGPQLKKLAAEVEAHGPGAGEVTARLARIMTVSWVDLGVLFFVVWAMVTKPGL